MEKEEWKAIAKMLRSVYSQSNFLADIDSVQSWYFLLKDLSAEQIKGAVLEYTLTNKFPPTVADIRELATKGQEVQDWSAGWQQVIKAIGKYGYTNEQGALDSMDEITRESVKRVGWKSICQSEKIEVERANFRIIYSNIIRDLQKGRVIKGLQIGTTQNKALSGLTEN